MGAVSDSLGDPKYGFFLATAFSALLVVGLLLNWILEPTRQLLQTLDRTEYLVADDPELRLETRQ
jgi:hypothetical protein